jgi:hypothetical protein
MESAPAFLSYTQAFYKGAAHTPDVGLCCTTAMPDPVVPLRVDAMNDGCGSTVHPRDLSRGPRITDVDVGGGLELLQFAWSSRRPGAFLGVDSVAEMLQAARENQTPGSMCGLGQRLRGATHPGKAFDRSTRHQTGNPCTWVQRGRAAHGS